nr:MAG: putative capsid protein [Narnaviridae sp.]
MYSPMTLWHPIQVMNNNNSNNNNNNNNSRKNGKEKKVNRKKKKERRELMGPQSTVMVPSAVGSVKQFRVSRKSTERFTNSEAIYVVLGSTGFSNAGTFLINPGLATTFPWLSTIAARWQQYKFNSLTFRYETRTSSTTAGAVILSPEYNPDETAPISESVASNTLGAVEGSCWQNVICRMDPKAMFPIGPRKLVRSYGIPGSLTTYDAGRFTICPIGQGSAAPIGKLWVDYDIEFFVPQSTVQALVGPTQVSQYTVGVAGQTLTSSTAVNLLAPQLVVDPLKVGAQDASGFWRPPIGNYRIWGAISIASAASTSLRGDIQIFRNGIQNNPTNPIIQTAQSTSATSVVIIQLYFSDIVNIINSTDTVSINVVQVSSVTCTVLPTLTVFFQLV